METFAGLPVVRFEDGKAPDVDDPAAVAWRIEVDWEDGPDDFAEVLDGLLSAVGPALTTLVVGPWGSVGDHPAPIDALAARAGRLPNLRALFLGDIVYEESEVSWITPCDPTEILPFFPKLVHLRARGSNGFTPLVGAPLEALVLESGGLPASTVRAVGASDLPALGHLELWLGDDSYGGDSRVDDLAEILGGARLPALRYLGLCNAEAADEVAVAVSTAPVVARLEVLDLSMGTLGDEGARALLSGQPLTHLRRLDLHRHYLSEEMAARIVAGLPGVDVDLDDRQERTVDRVVAVSE
ncbi:STM4015 family protein [Virgisporangium ochraceum]|uniref:Cytoplasmic protein n=1 Tax=Virgisporangium ochraceum TaxID=65505 RepID=A0A8J4EH36_9ACTN|nr:STM4015 family protein [Virgisporangium ochraceum]GIJ74308.1 hypothetical protein Voc01_092250 [Virgisporangium ochraceum]